MTRATIDFDPFSEQHFNDPYGTYRRLRDEAPVYYSEKYNFYALSRHADVAAAFKDFETYSSAYGVTLEEIQSGQHSHNKSIIWMDPPEHRRMRSLVNKVFTPRAIQAQEEVIRDRITHYLSKADPANFDVVADFSALFPVEVITIMLGVPEADRQNVRLWLETSLERPPGRMTQSRAGNEAMMKTGALYYNIIQERRVEPQDDMISRLCAVEVEREDGTRTSLDDVEIAGFCTLLGGAGAETVAKLLGIATVVFSKHRDQWEQLRADRSKIPAAVEELLRYEGPVQYDCRYVTKDVELHGTTIPQGAAIMLLGAAANRDERAFTDAEIFDINRDRAQAQNLAFGYGIHSCLGAALARLESVIALDYLLDFMPDYEVDVANVKRTTLTSVNGYARVPVRVRQG
ncbi:cytochrome P450 [Mycobacterium sp. TNTM28]|uniref:Cytochrome P450 n=1 Tax=[Mycobacterium] fortunisiensis TaxID=2600579 RepID=A0ABS6KIV4_9MYCO|nr:cytochrome P450 [[Mycobacterium] fortunisiensis]MBU9763448.1 cytochrome P450 [[Mycobacterium] fortunisiensis]